LAIDNSHELQLNNIELPNNLPLCACGCGFPVKHTNNKFLRGHHLRTKEFKENLQKYNTPENHRKQSESLKLFYKTPQGKTMASHHSNVMKKLLSEGTPLNAKMKEIHQSIDFRLKMHIKGKKVVDTPQFSNFRNASLATWKDPIRREISRINFSILWEIPEVRDFFDRRNHINNGMMKIENRNKARVRAILQIQKNGMFWHGPNRSELALYHIILQVNKNYRYNNGIKVIKFTNKNKVPDFYCLNSNKVIELFGEYWHKPEEEQTLIEQFDNVGYKCLVIWCNELKNNPMSVKNKIINFEGIVNNDIL